MVAKTKCSPIGFAQTDRSRLSACLYSLNTSELIASIPDNWHADGWSYGVFDPSWQYAPLLLIGGQGGTLPYDYISTFNQTARAPNAGVPLIIGVTRQESDFSPGKDVRNMSKVQFANFLASEFDPFYRKRFVEQLVHLYVDVPMSERWAPQKVYSEIITDATTLCPSIHLATTMAEAQTHPVYLYAASKVMSTPPGFCVLQPFNKFEPPYCPQYSFHAVDMFSLFQPEFDAAIFNYKFSQVDREFGDLIQSRMLEFAANGTVNSWPYFSTNAESFTAVDLSIDERKLPAFKRRQCDFWLSHGFYNRIGLIN